MKNGLKKQINDIGSKVTKRNQKERKRMMFQKEKNEKQWRKERREWDTKQENENQSETSTKYRRFYLRGITRKTAIFKLFYTCN